MRALTIMMVAGLTFVNSFKGLVKRKCPAWYENQSVSVAVMETLISFSH
jgi:hypothetical protein